MNALEPAVAAVEPLLTDDERLFARVEAILQGSQAQWPEALPPPLPQRRTAPRANLVTVVDFWSESNFYTGFSTDVASGGLFVTTPKVLPVGSLVRVSLTIPGQGEVDAVAEVRWVRAYDPEEPTLFPGLGVRFLSLTPEATAAIDAFIATRAPIICATPP